MSTTPSIDSQIILMLKNALEFNAGIVSIAAVSAGNLETRKQRQQFVREYDRLAKDYSKKQQLILDEVIKSITEDEQKTQRH